MLHHASVNRKLNLLDILPSIKNMIISFIIGRSEKTRIAVFMVNSMLILVLYRVLESSPALCILVKSDLHPISPINHICEFADDTNLLVHSQM